ncbi:transmembrane protein 16H [Thecamonas trahens ATCC 50062]|uniref:Transmembrane protein 16H n=1 Tax=Thecamonas trahens ATCC 50062 TaxID=461836 RepID=A0A0L0DKN3_THETB|nr:transmembrane protein 16H [Thecamonas trahens ATCC 50062]KNC52591.1 transmembrane protein 16H [Thecamonas trahens ATCC 50062]|eukprot:XP_013755150.1 transmembrane protein 16H [Thecamonas trahens ATCC 50062]
MPYVLEFDVNHEHFGVMHRYVRDVLEDAGLDVEHVDIGGDGESAVAGSGDDGSRRWFLVVRASRARLEKEYTRERRLGIGLFAGDDPVALDDSDENDDIDNIGDENGKSDDGDEISGAMRSGEAVFNARDALVLLREIVDGVEVAESDMDLSIKSRRRYGGMLPPLAECGLGMYEPVVESLIHTSNSLIQQAFPLHARRARTEVWHSVMAVRETAVPEPVREYFGDKATLFLEWALFYTKWMVVLAGLGLAVWLLEEVDHSHDNVLVAAYSAGLVVWASGFALFWARRQSALAWEWGTLDIDDALAEEVRPEFEGEMDESPVTGRLVKTYPEWKRQLKYAVSVPVTLAMLGVSVAVMVAGLNATAAIDPDSFLFVPALNGRGGDGRGLAADDDSLVVGMLPSLVYTVVILVVNEVYSRIAVCLNKWENHRTRESYEAALILKQIPFQLFNSFVGLFYLAFVECNMVELRVQLRDLFMTDWVRRVVVGALIPYVLKKYAEYTDAAVVAASKKADAPVPSSSPRFVLELLVEADQDRMATFDDWTELVTQLGYVAFFSAAFPLAPLLAVLGNVVELRALVFRYAFLVQRADPVRAKSIGVWMAIVKLVCLLAVIINVGIFGYTTNQARAVFAFFGLDLSIVGHMALVITLEHAAVLAKAVVEWVVPEIPAWVTIARARTRFLLAQSIRERERRRIQERERERRQAQHRTIRK